MNERPAILVVEDHPLNMKLVRSLLTLAGYRILEAENARQALALAATHRPALILMDIQLPDMDGLEATRLLKNQKETKDIPVVALTAHAMPDDKGKAKEVGCVGYISKPIDTRNFIRILEGYLPPETRKDLQEPTPAKGEGAWAEEEKDQTQASFDPLTGPPNKNHIRKHLDRELKRASRRGYPLSVLLLGLEDVQGLEAKGGPQEEDRFLKRLGTALRASVREIDFVARYGRDTFLLILPYTDGKEALIIAERLKRVVEETQCTPDASPSPILGARMGIADYPAQGASPEDLLNKVEIALGRARNTQEDRVKVFGDP